MNRTYKESSEPQFTLDELQKMPHPTKVLMVDPAWFDVEYVINPHMKGHIGQIDKERARWQWQGLKEAYERLGMEVNVLDGVKGLPDMVFCANQSLPCLDEEGNKIAVMSRMHAPQRRDEVPIVENWLQSAGYRTLYPDLNTDESFEGMGDAIWHPGRRMLWGGYGYRTSGTVYSRLADMLNVPVMLLELTDEKFYHLDTCMCLLNENTVMFWPGAFTEEGLELIRTFFDTVIEVNKEEAEKLLAANAVSPDGKHVLIQRGCTDTNQKLKRAGFTVLEVDTDEFLKSGGSVFCMKLFYW